MFSEMKSAVLALLTSAMVVLAIPTESPTKVSRDINTINSVISQVAGIVDQLDTSVKTFSGNSTGLLNICNNLSSSLAAGVSTVAVSSYLGVTDALSLQPSVDALSKAAKALVGDLSAAQPAFQRAGHCGPPNDAIT
jgi:hypothetical protein